ncbi:MAG: IS110 family transposase [Solirubrobacteraceae bacterium]
MLVVSGRKTDTIDAQWIAQLLACGLLRGSLVPPKPIRELRDLTRYRKALIYERGRAVNRLHKVLEDAGVKLACVATDVIGVSGRAMMRALIDGNADADALAELAKGKLRNKLPALRKALEGRFASTTRSCWSGCSRTSTCSRTTSPRSRRGSRSRSPLSRRRCSCCARSPACSNGPLR